MGNSMAYPVFTNSSATDVYALAQRLRALMSWSRPTVRLAAELQTAEGVWRMVNVLPNAPYEAEGVPFDPERWGHEYRADTLPTTDGELEALLPILVDTDVPADGVEQTFVRALGTGPATIDWHGVWPDAPELGLLANSKYEGVQAVFNTNDVDWERPAASAAPADPDRSPALLLLGFRNSACSQSRPRHGCLRLVQVLQLGLSVSTLGAASISRSAQYATCSAGTGSCVSRAPV